MANNFYNPFDPNNTNDPFGDQIRSSLSSSFGSNTPLTPLAPTGTGRSVLDASALEGYNPSAGQTAQAAGAPKSSIDQMIESLLGNQKQTSPMADLGSVLGSFSQGEKANRVVKGNFQQDFDSMMLDRELRKNQLGLDVAENRRADESDAMRKLQQTSYLMGEGAPRTPQNISINGRVLTLPQFANILPKAPTAAERQGASTLQSQMLQRLQPGGSFSPTWDYKPMDPKEYTDQGMLERLGSYGGAITGGLGAFGGNRGGAGNALDAIMGGVGKVGDVLGTVGKVKDIGSGIGKLLGFSKGAGSAATATPTAASGLMSGISKAIPYVGLATGGLGLIRDQGAIGNMMNGFTVGSSLGSIVPGLGTLVGGGIGALGGLLRGGFSKGGFINNAFGGPSKEELAGRQVGDQFRQAVVQGATPQQIAQAQEAERSGGWKGNMGGALEYIVLQNKLMPLGFSVEQVGSMLQQMHSAQKKGPEAVAQVGQRIAALMNGGRA